MYHLHRNRPDILSSFSRRLSIMSELELGLIGSFLTLCALSFFLNGTFLIVICKSWKVVKERRITYHVTYLAISDCIVGASAFCLVISKIVTGGMTTLGLAFTKIAWMATLTSLLSVCMMAVERAVCIIKPHTWTQILPLKRILQIMAGNWVLALTLAIIKHYYNVVMSFIFLVLFFIPIIVTSLVYVNMYIKIRSASKVRDETEHNSAAKIKERRNSMIQRKIGTFVLILVLILIISVSPLYITVFIEVSCELFKLKCKLIETVDKVHYYFHLLAMMNHVVNPIFYAWRISLYRQAFWKMFGRAGSENPQTVYLSTIN